MYITMSSESWSYSEGRSPSLHATTLSAILSVCLCQTKHSPTLRLSCTSHDAMFAAQSTGQCPAPPAVKPLMAARRPPQRL